LHSALSLKSSLLIRVIENLESVWTPPHVAVAANEPPIHLFETREAHATTAAQLGSAGAHAVFVAALVFMMLHAPAAKQRNPHSGMAPIPTMQYAPPKWTPAAEEKPGGNVSYPNAADRVLGFRQNPGGDIFLHGNCVTIGCIPITDEGIRKCTGSQCWPEHPDGIGDRRERNCPICTIFGALGASASGRLR